MKELGIYNIEGNALETIKESSNNDGSEQKTEDI